MEVRKSYYCCVSQRVWKISRKPSVVVYFRAYSFLPLFSCTFLEASSLVSVPDDTNSMTALKLPLMLTCLLGGTEELN